MAEVEVAVEVEVEVMVGGGGKLKRRKGAKFHYWVVSGGFNRVTLRSLVFTKLNLFQQQWQISESGRKHSPLC